MGTVTSVKLAIDGGTPVAEKLIRREHDGVMEQEEIEAATDVIRSGRLWLYNGRYTARRARKFCHCPYTTC